MVAWDSIVLFVLLLNAYSLLLDDLLCRHLSCLLYRYAYWNGYLVWNYCSFRLYGRKGLVSISWCTYMSQSVYLLLGLLLILIGNFTSEYFRTRLCKSVSNPHCKSIGRDWFRDLTEDSIYLTQEVILPSCAEGEVI